MAADSPVMRMARWRVKMFPSDIEAMRRRRMKGVVLRNLKSTAQIAADCQVEEGVVRAVSVDLVPIWEDGNDMEYWWAKDVERIVDRVRMYLIRTEDSRKKIRGVKALGGGVYEAESDPSVRVEVEVLSERVYKSPAKDVAGV
jgi:hypothetical protein